MAPFSVYIPARHQATRLPGKPLLDIAGKPMLQYVYDNACAAGAHDVVVATDDERIAEAARGFGAPVVLTDPAHPSGTDRIAEAVTVRDEPDDRVIVNVQADEPLLPPSVIAQVAEVFERYPATDISTVAEALGSREQLDDPNIVKVVRGANDRAIYFSRAPVPYPREPEDFSPADRAFRRHVGIYGYRVRYLRQFVSLQATAIELIERLEQLRALAHGHVITVVDAIAGCGVGVDTAADLARVRRLLANP